MREMIVFKGYRDGLELIIDESADFGAILLQLKDKLDSATNFFMQGAMVKIPAVRHLFTDSQQQQIHRLLADYGLTIKEEEPETLEDQASSQELEFTAEAISCSVNQENYETNAFIVKRTLRSGQRVKHTGAVVVLGDVNPGAEVVAGGDIMIFGACRGVVHAGSEGNEQATITANRLQAMQIRIADMIARSPDSQVMPRDCAERARIADGQVIIEPAHK